MARYYSPQEINQIIRSISEKYAPGDEEFYRVMSAIALAESGGRANKQLVNKMEASYGLYQANIKGGRGTGYTPEQLKRPEFNTELAAKELIQYYNKAKALGLKGRRLVEYVSKYGQRPAAGNEKKAGDRYGQFVGGSEKPEKKYGGFELVKPVLAAETTLPTTPPTPPTPVSTPPTTYTVKKGDTLWDLAQRFMGSGFRWRDIQGYAGDPRKLPIGTVLQIPTTTITPKPKEVTKPFTPTPVPTPTPRQINPNQFNQPNMSFRNATFMPNFGTSQRSQISQTRPIPTPVSMSQRISTPSAVNYSNYAVKSGETLWGIAQRNLGSGSRWRELGYAGDPRRLQIGTTLKIPMPSAAR